MKRISTTLIFILALCLGLIAKGNSVFAEVDSCSANESKKVNRLILIVLAEVVLLF